jgi:hypothetical protein
MKCLACSHPTVDGGEWCREHQVEVEYVRRDPSIRDVAAGALTPLEFVESYGVPHTGDTHD